MTDELQTNSDNESSQIEAMKSFWKAFYGRGEVGGEFKYAIIRGPHGNSCLINPPTNLGEQNGLQKRKDSKKS